MKLVNIDRPVTSEWLLKEGRRFDAGPFLSGAVEARLLLEELDVPKEPLHSLTKGHNGGIYNGPMFKRRYVDDPEHGVPFISSSSFMLADLSNLPLLSKKDARSRKLAYLELKEGMTLISCSGTIGRMGYVRPDMAGMWSSQDVMKVVPDPDKVPPGYLYAYLSSKYGVPLVVSGTYGAIIQHIEPEHIATLPVPRLAPEIEVAVHRLITESAALRSSANAELDQVVKEIDLVGLKAVEVSEHPRISTISSIGLEGRLGARYFDKRAEQVRTNIARQDNVTLQDFCSRLYLPGIFKRIHTESIAYGKLYYSGASLFWLEPQPKGVLSPKSALFEDVRIFQGDVLVQAFGSAGGLIGRPVWIGRFLDDTTTTHMLVRLRPKRPELAPLLFAFLSSQSAYLQISRTVYGGTIPHFDERCIGSVMMPIFSNERESALNNAARSCLEHRDAALEKELEARAIVEKAIEDTARG